MRLIRRSFRGSRGISRTINPAAIVESLETRQLLSASPSVWRILGDQNRQALADRIVVMTVPGKPATLQTVVNGEVIGRRPAAWVSGIQIRSGDGNDRVVLRLGKPFRHIPSTVSGGAGNDSLIGGWGNDHLLGDAGDDNIDGGRGRDAVRGGDGIDQISPGVDRARDIVRRDNEDYAVRSPGDTVRLDHVPLPEPELPDGPPTPRPLAPWPPEGLDPNTPWPRLPMFGGDIVCIDIPSKPDPGSIVRFLPIAV